MENFLVVGAMKTEIAHIKGAVCTGFGKEKARQVIQKVIKTQKPSLFISVGLVGAVSTILKAGDVFIPDEVVDLGNPGKKYYPLPLPHGISGKGIRSGLLVTVPVVFQKEDKYKLKKALPEAMCVDMETSAVAEALEETGIPFLCIKAVSDELDFDFRDKKLLGRNIKKAIDSYTGFLCKLLKK